MFNDDDETPTPTRPRKRQPRRNRGGARPVVAAGLAPADWHAALAHPAVQKRLAGLGERLGNASPHIALLAALESMDRCVGSTLAELLADVLEFQDSCGEVVASA